MKRLLVLIHALLISAPLLAASITLNWDEDLAATGYRVYSSTDLGVTWIVGGESNILPITLTGLPDTGLILLRACAFNLTQETCRTNTGFFFNGDWRPLSVINLSTP